MKRSDVVNGYLFAAFALVWIIFMLYAWKLSRRQAELKKGLEEVRSKLEAKGTSVRR